MSKPTQYSPRPICIGALAALSCVFAAGCVARFQAEPVVVESDATVVDAVPVDIETYPRERYEGRIVYLVDGRWYYRAGPRWITYRREPVELGRRRVIVERRRHHEAEPAYRR